MSVFSQAINGFNSTVSRAGKFINSPQARRGIRTAKVVAHNGANRAATEFSALKSASAPYRRRPMASAMALAKRYPNETRLGGAAAIGAVAGYAAGRSRQ